MPGIDAQEIWGPRNARDRVRQRTAGQDKGPGRFRKGQDRTQRPQAARDKSADLWRAGIVAYTIDGDVARLDLINEAINGYECAHRMIATSCSD